MSEIQIHETQASWLANSQRAPATSLEFMASSQDSVEMDSRSKHEKECMVSKKWGLLLIRALRLYPNIGMCYQWGPKDHIHIRILEAGIALVQGLRARM